MWRFKAIIMHRPLNQSDNYLAEILDDIRLLKQGNSNIRLHFEYVPMKDNKAETYASNCSTGNSVFCINENEIK